MSDDMYEVAFSGEIAEGADIEQVKQAVAKLFKADEAKLEQLFSGKRIVIKKNINLVTAQKYQTALNNARALCEIKNLSAVTAVEEVEIKAPEAEPAAPPPAAVKRDPVIDENIPPAPNTDPLHIDASSIEDLEVSVAPVGSDLQDEIREVEPLEADLEGLSMAPVGSDLGVEKEETPPPVPDISGLSLADS